MIGSGIGVVDDDDLFARRRKFKRENEHATLQTSMCIHLAGNGPRREIREGERDFETEMGVNWKSLCSRALSTENSLLEHCTLLGSLDCGSCWALKLHRDKVESIGIKWAVQSML